MKMSDTEFQLSSIKCDLEVITSNIDDLLNTQQWFMDDYFAVKPTTAEGRLLFAHAFDEMRIKLSQQDMIMDYLNMEAKKLIEKIAELEKKVEKKPTSSSFGEQ